MAQPRTTSATKPIDESLIAYIAAYLANQGVAPSVRDVAAFVGTGVSPAHGHLKRLERLGRIKINGRRDITIIEINPLARFSSQELLTELERRDNDPTWWVPARLGAAVCTCGKREGSPEARDCETQVCPLRAPRKEAA